MRERLKVPEGCRSLLNTREAVSPANVLSQRNESVDEALREARSERVAPCPMAMIGLGRATGELSFRYRETAIHLASSSLSNRG